MKKFVRVGNDIDLRYPASPNAGGSYLWSQAAKKYSSENDFISELENILEDDDNLNKNDFKIAGEKLCNCL